MRKLGMFPDNKVRNKYISKQYEQMTYPGERIQIAEQSTYSSSDFLERVYKYFKRKGVTVECVQTDNGFEFTNKFSNSKRDLPTKFELTAKKLGIRHKLIRPYTPRHNGKVERSHREDQKRFYDTHRFYSLTDFGAQLAAHQARSNNRPMRPLNFLSTAEFFSFDVQDH